MCNAWRPGGQVAAVGGDCNLAVGAVMTEALSEHTPGAVGLSGMVL
jgi:hypothetical protein